MVTATATIMAALERNWTMVDSASKRIAYGTCVIAPSCTRSALPAAMQRSGKGVGGLTCQHGLQDIRTTGQLIKLHIFL